METKSITLVLTQIVSNVPRVVYHYFDTLEPDLKKFIMPFIERDVDMIWDDAKEKFELATHCHVCRKELNRLTEPIVRDNYHFTGMINKSKYKLPVVFHNLCGYDANLIFQRIKQKHGKIDVIPNILNSTYHLVLDA